MGILEFYLEFLGNSRIWLRNSRIPKAFLKHGLKKSRIPSRIPRGILDFIAQKRKPLLAWQKFLVFHFRFALTSLA